MGVIKFGYRYACDVYTLPIYVSKGTFVFLSGGD